MTAHHCRRAPATLLLFALAACVLLVFEAATLPWRVSCDVSMYLDTGKLLLEGKTPYIDFVDINLPFIMHLSAAFVWTAVRMGLPPVSFFQATVAVLAVASAVATAVRMRAGLRLSLSATSLVVFALVATSWSWFYTLESRTRLPSWTAGALMSQYAQREHLFALAFLPYFADRWAGARGLGPGRTERAIVGVLLGVTMMLKPHFVVFVALTEAYWAARARTVRALLSTETTCAAVSAGCFAVLVGCVTPLPAWREYVLRWAPLIGGAYGDSYGIPVRDVLFSGSVLASTLVLGLLLRWDRLKDIRDWAVPLALGIGLVLVQHKPWNYQRIPMISVAVLVVAVAASTLGQDAPRRAWRERILQGAPVAVCAVWLGALIALAVVQRSGRLGLADTAFAARMVLERIERRTDAGDGVLFLTSTPYRAYPALFLAGRAPGSRYLWAFPIALLHPRAVEDGPPAPSPGKKNEAQFLGELNEDILVRKPTLIFIEREVPFSHLPAGWSVAHYIRATEVWRTIEGDYRRHADLERLEVWERAPGA